MEVERKLATHGRGITISDKTITPCLGRQSQQTYITPRISYTS
jgi:hypothetical protein